MFKRQPRFRIERNELNEYTVSYKTSLFGMRWYIEDGHGIYYRPFACSTRRSRIREDKREAALEFAREEAARDIKNHENARKGNTWTLWYKEP